MAEKGLFFNAFPDDSYETGYDRNYSADDISDWLSIVCENGVVKTDNEAGTGIPQGLKVVASEGMSVSVNVGKATIRGKGYINNSLLPLSIATAPTGTTPRYDMVILRQDNTQSVDARKNYVLIASVDHTPTISDLTRNSDIYDLLLGYVAVQPNATSIQQTYITDTRGDEELCPWFTAVKGYDDYYDAIIQRFEYDTTLSTSSTIVITDLASNLYNNKYSFINVYVNGLKEESDNYTIDATNQFIKITFSSQKNAGADISVILNNFVDGEGLSTAIDDYNQWVEDVADLKTLKEFNYYCNGSTDNVEIANIVNDYFTNASYRYNQGFKLNIIGNFGYTAAMSGDGSVASPYVYFNFEKSNVSNKRVMLDFSNCSMIEFANVSGKSTIIFSGCNICIKNANILAINSVASGTSVVMFDTQPRVKAEGCRFWVYGYTNSYIATRGEFNNCIVQVRNAGGDSYCYKAANGVFLSVVGGQAVAHTGLSNGKSAAVYSAYANCMITIFNLIVAKLDYTSYYQTNSILHTLGKLTCVGLISTLAVSTTTGATVTGTMVANPYNQVW